MSSVKHYPPEGFTERLRDTFLESKMEVTQLSKLSGVSRTMVYNYIYVGDTPNITALAAICKVLKVSADYLLFGGSYEK